VHRSHQRAAQRDGEVQPRLLAAAVVQVVAVVDDVDAADEGHLAVDHAQLLVQPAQLAGCSQLHQRSSGRKTSSCTPLSASHCRAAVQRGHRPEAVDHHPHRHTARAAATSASATARPAASSWKM
jgi:hypothetical protein